MRRSPGPSAGAGGASDCTWTCMCRRCGMWRVNQATITMMARTTRPVRTRAATRRRDVGMSDRGGMSGNRFGRGNAVHQVDHHRRSLANVVDRDAFIVPVHAAFVARRNHEWPEPIARDAEVAKPVAV